MINSIRKRRPYSHEDQSSEQPALHYIPHFQQHPSPPASASPLHHLTHRSPPNPFASPQELSIIQHAAAILDVHVQKLLDLRVGYDQSQQPQHRQQYQQHPYHPPAHQEQQQPRQHPTETSPQGRQFKRPRLSSTSDPVMFYPRGSQPLMGARPDLQEKCEGQTEDVVVPRRPCNLAQGGLAIVTGSLSDCIPIFCNAFDSDDYTGQLTASAQFEYGPGRPFDDTKPQVSEQQFNPVSWAPSEPSQPAAMFTTGPVDDGPINYIPQYPAMQAVAQGTTAAQLARAEEMVYPPMHPPMSTYFGRQHAGSWEPGLDDESGAPDSMMHVTDPESVTLLPQAVNPSAIPSGQKHPVIPDGAESASSLPQGYPDVLVPAASGRGVTASAREVPGSMAQDGPPTPHPGFPNNTHYLYEQTGYSADPYAAGGYDVWPPGARPPSTKRGPFKNNADREKTAQTRRIGSCIRCRMQRIRCHINANDEKGPCLTCAKVLTSKVWRLPCLRYKITDIQLSKPSKQVEGCEWTRRWNEGVVDDIADWDSRDIRVIRVSQGLSRDRYVELEVRRFIPQKGDKLDRSWIGPDGRKRSVGIPPYAICDTQKAKNAYLGYIDEAITDSFDAVLGPSNELLQRTYRIALARSLNRTTSDKERKLLQTTLRLWMSIRLTTRSEIIVGDETLGMPRNILDETSPLAGKIPVPPVMGAQIDLILINQIQKQWRKQALEMLQEMVQNNKQKAWMTTYLVAYMLLHNTALITAHAAGYARKHGLVQHFARESLVGKYHEGANILLAYWHYCNKNVYPFSKECKDSEFQQLASLDEATMQFIRATREVVRERKAEWSKLQDEENSEDDYYFVSQLYEENWKPRENLPVGGRRRRIREL